MKVHLQDLAEPQTLTIDGNEPWLERIYADFGVKADGERSKISGELTLTQEGSDTVHVVGQLQYAPLVPCGRCDLQMAWPLILKIDSRFYPETFSDRERDKTLSPADLDAYYLQDEAVDLEILINDAVQMALPATLVRVGDDDKCLVCGMDLSSDKVYGSDDPAVISRNSPFAVLANLKVKPKIKH